MAMTLRTWSEKRFAALPERVNVSFCRQGKKVVAIGPGSTKMSTKSTYAHESSDALVG